MRRPPVREYTWPVESEAERQYRRRRLRRLDALLTQIEEHNVTVGGDIAVPISLLATYLGLGGTPHLPTISGADVLSATLDLQEGLVLVVTEVAVAPRPRPPRLRRRRGSTAPPSP